MFRALLRPLLAGALAVTLAGCGADDPTDARDGVPREPGTESPAATQTSEPWAAVAGPLGRCGPQPARVGRRDFRLFTLRGPGRTMPAFSTGAGSTVAILLHQTDGGICGWLDFADRIASVPGQAALAFDLCGYGDSDCAADNTDADRQVEQVQHAIDHAVRRMRAERVVLVGASMGGSVAVLAAAADQRVDAVVDLSGPDLWRGATVQQRAADVRVPLLVVMADDEGEAEVQAAQAAAGTAPRGEFLGADAGHGWELLQDGADALTPVGERVLELVAGGATAAG